MRIRSAPRTWEELHTQLWAHSLASKEGYGPYIAYRGLAKIFPDLRTGIQRLGDPTPYTGKKLIWREKRIIETFGVYAHDRLPTGYTDWDVLLLGQHYRLPTRLLDWTASPYAALFFATEDKDHHDCDGVVWCVKRIDTLKALPRKFQKYLKLQSGKMFTLRTMNDQFDGGLEDFDADSLDALVWFEPPSLDPRIVNQYAYFSLMPGVGSLQHEWLEQHPHWYWGVKVPARLKPEIRRRLQVMNITERTIYTGLEGIARWIRAYYGP
jgi:hypothetical protein